MRNNVPYLFIDTDSADLVSSIISVYERITGVTVLPASPEKLFIQWVANVLIGERALTNYVGNQNIPSRAEGANLDALGELFYLQQRPAAKAAHCTERFWISEAQKSAVLIPQGTRVTDASQTLYWQTTQDAYIPAGELYADVRVQCQPTGAIGNGYAVGQLDTIVDVFDYYTRCENITESDSGADEATDEEFYELLRASMDAYSCAGSIGGYVYWAKQVSTEIADVRPIKAGVGMVYIYVLMDDGTIATEEIKASVLEACSADAVRPLTDYVQVKDAPYVPYDIDITYYIPSDTTKSAAAIRTDVEAAVKEYVAWQSARFGRDINPDKLRDLLFHTGVKRIVLRSPVFTVLQDGREGLSLPVPEPEVLGERPDLASVIPQIAAVGDIQIVNGGYEDE